MIAFWFGCYVVACALGLLLWIALSERGNPRNPRTHLGPQDDDLRPCRPWHVRGATPAKKYR